MLRIKFFGTPQVSLHDQSLSSVLVGKRLALFIYLVVSGEPRPRTVLTDLLWTGMSEQNAKGLLRNLLYALRQMFGDYFIIDRQTAAFNRQLPYWLDVEAFANTVASQKEPQPDILPGMLTEALSLYQYDFLDGFAVQEAPVFEAWLLGQRKALHSRAVTSWQQLVQTYWRAQHYEKGLTANQRLLDLEPWNEEAHRQQMRLLVAVGQHRAALLHYDRCCQSLREEVDAPPSSETTALYEQIKTQLSTHTVAPTLPAPGRPLVARTATRLAHPPITSPAAIPLTLHREPNQSLVSNQSLVLDWGSMPIPQHFYGRQQELAMLQQWVMTERSRLVSVVGMGGQGKTTLVAHFLHTLSKRTTTQPDTTQSGVPQAGSRLFEGIIWRSLFPVSSLSDILHDWLYHLSNGQVVTLPRTWDGQLTLLLEYLQCRRFLLVLDSTETFANPAPKGRPLRDSQEQAAYRHLLQLFREHSHQSCLIITDRTLFANATSQPRPMETQRQLQLTGLTLAAGEQLLKSYGLHGDHTLFHTLHQHYSGNPLALTLVARSIDELFDGDVQRFLQEGDFSFADIDTVMEQQFSHLSPLEQELLTWLALEQEPVASQQLWSNLAAAPARRDFTNALQSLLRRSLVYQHEGNYTVQQVIRTYVRNRLLDDLYQELTSPQEDDQRDDRGFSLTLSQLNRFALQRAHAKEHVRLDQVRLLLSPLLQRLLQYWGRSGLINLVHRRIGALRHAYAAGAPLPAGYATANLFHLLLQLEPMVVGYDFSSLTLRQVDLRNARVHGCNFSQATLQDCRVTDTFALITALSFHPTGEWLATGDYHGDIGLWRPGEDHCYAVIPAHHRGISTLATSPDGRCLASGGSDGFIYLWDVAHRLARYHWVEGGDEPRSLTFTPDGRWLVASGAVGVVHIYAVDSGELIYTLVSPNVQIGALAFTSDGQWLAGGGCDGRLYLWQVTRLSPVTTNPPDLSLLAHTGMVTDILFSRGGYTLYSTGEDGLIHLWEGKLLTARQIQPSKPDPELQSLQPRLTLRGHHGAVHTLALSPTGQWLLSGGVDQVIRRWDTRQGVLVETLSGHQGVVCKLAFQPQLTATLAPRDRARLVSVSEDRRLLTWEIASDAEAGNASDYPTPFSPSRPAGTTPGATHGRLHQVVQGYCAALCGLAFTPDGNMLVSAGFDQHVNVWDTTKGTHHALLHQHDNWIVSLAVSPTGHTIAWGDHEGQVWLWSQASDVAHRCRMGYTSTVQRLNGHHSLIGDLVFSPDGQTLASCSADHSVMLWDVVSGQPLQQLKQHTGKVWAGAFSPDGCSFATASNDGFIRLWDVADLLCRRSRQAHLRQVLTDHRGPVYAVCFTPDGEQLVSAVGDHTLRTWSRAGQPLQVLRGHTRPVSALAVSPCVVDGVLAAASCDRTRQIRLWDLATGETLNRWEATESEIQRLTWRPDGKALAGASRDGSLHLWDALTGTPLHTLARSKPYAGTQITGVAGISEAQRQRLQQLGALP